MEPSKR